MTTDRPTGELGNLTIEEERKLQQAWAHILRLCDTSHASNDVGAWGETPHRSDGFQQHLASVPSELFRNSLWRIILLDHPDSLLLRFLRARKWDVEKAIEMMVSDMNWREEAKIDEHIIAGGESVALNQALSEDDKGFLHQYRCGKSYVRGVDKQHRPVYVVKARLHDPSMQTTKALQKYILHNIESIRILVKHPKDKACLFFDMTGFGLKNMDFEIAKFLTHVFEARYPETLGAIIIHNSPFVFWGVWKIVKGWLDPVVAAKVTFTRNDSELQEHIDKDNLQTAYGGNDEWEYNYIEPSHGDDPLLGKEDEKAAIQEDHDDLANQFETHTIEWLALHPDTPEAKSISAKRDELAEKLRANYWRLDPYIRATTYYHRAGVIGRTGEVDFMGAKQ
ncbi:unnamed protein product [Clonostachys solani]|uniref:CRAL-TRIO domain-containing protein n=1 Tax=Clonostachys solani TaxID=160281 RepID=A0A9N9Z0T0_9HYPO|nr:unnamed protein product [Clonostachys solani]